MVEPGRKIEVELVEVDDGEVDLSLEPADADRPHPLRTRARWRRAWPLALIALLVATAYGVTGLRERATAKDRWEALSAQDGFVPDLSRPLEPAWTVPPGMLIDVVHGDVALGVRWDGFDMGALFALDARTGTELWSLPSPDGESQHCRKLVEYPTGLALTCTFVLDEGRSGLGGERGYRFEHRDLATGELLAESQQRFGMAAASLDADLVELVADDEVVLRRVGLDGEVRWETRLGTLPSGTPYLGIVEVEGAIGVVLEDRALGVDGEGRVVVDHPFTGSSDVELQDGEMYVTFHGYIEPLAFGGFAVVTGAGDLSAVYDDSGELVHTEHGLWRSNPLDDGSLGRVVVYGGEEAAVLDLDSGAELFRDAGDFVVAILEGALLIEGRGKLRSVDVASGQERWSVGSGGVLGTDGKHLLVHESGGTSYVLRTVDVATGQEGWRLATGGQNQWVRVVGGLVVVEEDGRATAYRP